MSLDPEQPPLRGQGVARRAAALALDSIIGFGAFVVPISIGFDQASIGSGHVSVQLHGLPLVLCAVAALAYFTCFEKLRGATPGKLVCGLRVRAQDGSPLTWGAALVRNLLRIVDAFPYVLPYLVGAVAVWADPANRRVGDRPAATLVLDRHARPFAGEPPRRG